MQSEADDTAHEAQIVIMTHECIESDIDAAREAIKALPSTSGEVVKLRVEQLG